MGATQTFVVRKLLARAVCSVFAVLALAWAIATGSKFWSEAPLLQVVPHILAGETYRPGVLRSLITLPSLQDSSVRPSTLNRLAAVRLREAEEAIGAADGIDAKMDDLHRIVEESLASAPLDSFLWLVRFWVDNNRQGFQPGHLNNLRMSYALGPNEAWIAVRRNRFAMALLPDLPADLAAAANNEFVGLVRSQLYTQAADIITGPGWPFREMLLAQLKDLNETARRQLAKQLDERNAPVSIPGI